MPDKRQTNARLNLQTGGGEDHTTLSLRDHDFLSVGISVRRLQDLSSFTKFFGNTRGFAALRGFARLCEAS
jgi:hypothetical protein